MIVWYVRQKLIHRDRFHYIPKDLRAHPVYFIACCVIYVIQGIYDTLHAIRDRGYGVEGESVRERENKNLILNEHRNGCEQELVAEGTMWM
jgi:hypothetical protein